MAPAPIHEANKRGLGRLIETMTEALNIPIRSGGSTTFRQKLKKRGLEPDECYWLAHEPEIRGKKELDLDFDPPPDLAIEIENTKSAVDKLAVYAALGFPEVWRYNGESIWVFRLQADGTYLRLDQSPNFPFLALADLVRFLRLHGTTDETTWIRGFRAWVLETLAPLRPEGGGGA
jgi:Uma2 family endonuclease